MSVKKRSKSKKAISNYIATILLVAFVIAIITLVFLWGRSYIEEKAEKESALTEKQLECTNVEITIVNAFQQGDLAVIAIKNLQNIEISKFTFRLIGQATDVRESFEVLKGLEVKQYNIQFSLDEVKKLDEVDVIPWLKITEGYFVPCSNQHVIANIK